MSRKYSIYNQYLFLFCIIPFIILLIGIVIGIVNYKLFKANENILYQNEIYKVSTIIKEELDYINKFSDIVGEKISRDPSSKKIGEILKRTYSIAQIGRDIDISTLTKFQFISPNGFIIADIDEGELKSPVMLRKEEISWLEVAKKNPWKLQISPVVIKSIIKKNIIKYSIPINFAVTGKNNEFLGTIFTAIDSNKLNNKIKRRLHSEYIRFIILSKDNYILAHNISDNNLQRIDNKIFNSLNLNQGSIKALYDNAEFFIYKKMENYPFIILIGEITYGINKKFENLVILPIISSISICLLLLLFFWFFKNKLIIPIKDLSAVADKISAGKLNITIPEFQYSEIANLAKKLRSIKNYAIELNATKTLLEEHQIALEELNNNLEQKVEERTYELTKALAIKDEFLNNISHEIRIPIQGITAVSEELIENWLKLNDDKKYHYTSLIVGNSKRLFLLVANLLDLSQFKKGKLVLDLRLASINELIFNIIEESRSLYNIANISFLPVKEYLITIDKEKISQVLRNLLANAIKFGFKDTQNEIAINIEVITVADGLESSIKISISDRGQGIPDDETKLIFLPFTQSSRTKTNAGGRGLGLAICQNIIKAHGGEIGVKNNEDKGATFFFTLPIKQITQQNKISDMTQSKDITVIVIDDEETVLSTVEMMLQSRNYSVIKANGGNKGLDLIKNNHDKIDLILLDLMMPDIHGLNLLSAIKNDSLIKDIPVIIQSGVADEKEKEECINLGAVSFLSKPYNKKDLLEKIDNILFSIKL